MGATQTSRRWEEGIARMPGLATTDSVLLDGGELALAQAPAGSIEVASGVLPGPDVTCRKQAACSAACNSHDALHLGGTPLTSTQFLLRHQSGGTTVPLEHNVYVITPYDLILTS